MTDYEDLTRILKRCKYVRAEEVDSATRKYTEEPYLDLTKIFLYGDWSAQLYFYFDADGNAVDLELMGD